MTPYASIALYRRNGSIVFKPSRKEQPPSATQARKSAMRHWRASTTTGDILVKVIIAREFDGKLEVAERTPAERAWKQFTLDITDAAKEPHLAACIAELGIDTNRASAPVPDVLIINGNTYRRDI